MNEKNSETSRQPADYDHAAADHVEKKPADKVKQSPQQEHDDEDHG
jgi:hypothetical protein